MAIKTIDAALMGAKTASELDYIVGVNTAGEKVKVGRNDLVRMLGESLVDYYGVRIDLTSDSADLTRVGNPALHASLPVQSLMRRCLLNDAGQVTAYLHPTDSNKTDTGAAANLTGAAGQVMVEIPRHWRKVETEANAVTVLISATEQPGFEEIPRMFRSAYQAVVDRTDAKAPKLASVVNATAAFRGGNNNADYDGTAKSFLGMPSTAVSLTNFRTYARARGAAGKNNAGWNCDVYDAQLAVYWLFVIEYATLNCQKAYNAELTAEGYRQGGLGDGVSTLNWNNWSKFNGNCPVVKCGLTNTLGNASGVVEYTLPAEFDTTKTVKVGVPSYRGMENPFGQIYTFADGCKIEMQSDAAGGKSKFYVCSDPAKFQDKDATGYEYRGDLARKKGFISKLLLGTHGDNVAAATDGAYNTYYCDYYEAGNLPTTGTEWRAVMFGGDASAGSAAGLAYSRSSIAAGGADAYIGSRLCFLP